MAKKKPSKTSRTKAIIARDQHTTELGTQEIPPIKVVDKRVWAREQEGGEQAEPVLELNLKPTYVQELENKMALMEQRFREKTANYLDETQRIQDRLTREMERRLVDEKNKLIMDFVEVLDLLERAVDSSTKGDKPDTAPGSEVIRGLTMVSDLFHRKLEKLGLQAFGEEMDSFNPQLHEAVQVVETDQPDRDNKIVAVLQKGYQFHDKVVRPAQVSVGRYASSQ